MDVNTAIFVIHKNTRFRIVGAYMATTIKSKMGREALANTVSGDVVAVIRTVNSVAEENMKIRWSTTP